MIDIILCTATRNQSQRTISVGLGVQVSGTGIITCDLWTDDMSNQPVVLAEQLSYLKAIYVFMNYIDNMNPDIANIYFEKPQIVTSLKGLLNVDLGLDEYMAVHMRMLSDKRIRFESISNISEEQRLIKRAIGRFINESKEPRVKLVTTKGRNLYLELTRKAELDAKQKKIEEYDSLEDSLPIVKDGELTFSYVGPWCDCIGKESNFTADISSAHRRKINMKIDTGEVHCNKCGKTHKCEVFHDTCPKCHAQYNYLYQGQVSGCSACNASFLD